jgi:protein-L-isoaspartate(D-aspartate) O-methyltransferase
MDDKPGRPARGARFPLPLSRLGGAARPAPRELLRPQRLVRQAAEDAARTRTPSGLGLDSATVRARMVERLEAEGITQPQVLAAFAAVPRHGFVDSALANQAYEDTALPIGHGQTISKPSVVARMLQLLFEGAFARAHGHLGHVLEVGTGCGYQAALLAALARRVTSIERLRPLADKARDNLAGNGVRITRLVHGDGRAGHAPNAPYHSIVAAAGGDELPAAWTVQLALHGRLVAPLVDARAGVQRLVVIDRVREGPAGLLRRELDVVHFVPLKSGSL